MQDEAPGILSHSLSFPSTESSCYRWQIHGSLRGFLLFTWEGACRGWDVEEGSHTQVKNDPIQSTLIEHEGESEDTTYHCRIFISRDPFCDFKSFSATEVTKEICILIHTDTHSYTHSHAQAHRHEQTHSYIFTVTHTSGTHTKLHTVMCANIHISHHMCTQIAHHILVRTHWCTQR